MADVAEKLISEGHPSSDEFAANLKDLKSKWADLKVNKSANWCFVIFE